MPKDVVKVPRKPFTGRLGFPGKGTDSVGAPVVGGTREDRGGRGDGDVQSLCPGVGYGIAVDIRGQWFSGNVLGLVIRAGANAVFVSNALVRVRLPVTPSS